VSDLAKGATLSNIVSRIASALALTAGLTAATLSPGLAFAKDETSAPAIKWLDYKVGMAQAKEAGKPILVSFWADWCHYCRQMKSETYTDPKVAAEVTANFVPISVNTTTEPQLAADYYVRGLPTIWFLASDGTKITALPGYVDAPMFLKVLRFIDTRSYEKMDFQTFLNSGS
jgi:thioredoxin-related protein